MDHTVIDLFLYYSQKFTKKDIDYVKIRCPGQVVPPEEVYQE